jgi:hypothetical protein
MKLMKRQSRLVIGPAKLVDLNRKRPRCLAYGIDTNSKGTSIKL